MKQRHQDSLRKVVANSTAHAQRLQAALDKSQAATRTLTAELEQLRKTSQQPTNNAELQRSLNKIQQLQTELSECQENSLAFTAAANARILELEGEMKNTSSLRDALTQTALANVELQTQLDNSRVQVAKNAEAEAALDEHVKAAQMTLQKQRSQIAELQQRLHQAHARHQTELTTVRQQVLNVVTNKFNEWTNGDGGAVINAMKQTVDERLTTLNVKMLKFVDELARVKLAHQQQKEELVELGHGTAKADELEVCEP